jgi:hypothetical protein
VTAGFIIYDTLAQPDHGLHSEIGPEVPLHLFLGNAGIAIRIQQNLFGDQRRPFAIHVNGTAFVDDVGPVAIIAFDLEDLAGDEIVLIPGKVQSTRKPSPGIEAPVDASPDAAVIRHERRPDITHPRIVVGHLDDPHVRRKLRPSEFEVSG